MCLASRQQRAVHERRHGGPDVDVDLDRHRSPVALERAADLGVHRGGDGLPSDAHVEVAVGFLQLEGERTGAEHAWPAVGAQGIVDRTRAVDVEDATVGERDVDLKVVGVPLVGRGLDAHARQADGPAVVPDPGVDRLAQFGIVGLLREDELQLLAQPAAHITRHVTLPFVPRLVLDAGGTATP